MLGTLPCYTLRYKTPTQGHLADSQIHLDPCLLVAAPSSLDSLLLPVLTCNGESVLLDPFSMLTVDTRALSLLYRLVSP